MKELMEFDIYFMYRKIGVNVMRIRKEKGMSQLILSAPEYLDSRTGEHVDSCLKGRYSAAIVA